MVRPPTVDFEAHVQACRILLSDPGLSPKSCSEARVREFMLHFMTLKCQGRDALLWYRAHSLAAAAALLASGAVGLCRKFDPIQKTVQI